MQLTKIIYCFQRKTPKRKYWVLKVLCLDTQFLCSGWLKNVSLCLRLYCSSKCCGVHSESIFLFMQYFFFSRRLCFFWSLCLLLIAELINLDTSDKPTAGFFLKITSPSWIILSIWLDKFNSIDWLLKNWWSTFLK